MTQKTYSPRAVDIKRGWHLVDLKDKILGRAATQIAVWLIGKDKPYYMPNLDCGDYVVVTNADKVRVTGKKRKEKIYFSHSGYPGGFKQIRFDTLLKKDPSRVIELAVRGMLPKNKLRDRRLRRLKVFTDAAHPYADKFKEK